VITKVGIIYQSSAACAFDGNTRVNSVPCYRERAFEHFAILTRMALLCPVLMSYDRTQPVKEFIFDKAPLAAAHASTVVELRNGDLMSAWFGGTKEGAPDVAIWASTLSDRGWSRPIELARESGIATYNPVLFHTTDGRLWLYYKFGPHPTSWTGARRFSRDEGKTWSPVEHLPAGLYGPIRTKPLVLDDGTVVSGTSVESYRSWACWIKRSTDNGKTFAKYGPITVASQFVKAVHPRTGPEEMRRPFDWDETEGIIQPSVVWLGNHNLRLYARSTARTGKICVADSTDNGVTWTQAHPIALPNPNSGIDAVNLRDGRVVLIYNHSDPLNLAVSRDGEHFRKFRVLEHEPGEYSYPALIQGSNGDLHITYTWNRKKIRYVRVPLADVPKQ
jgi:predicted neuraminidase